MMLEPFEQDLADFRLSVPSEQGDSFAEKSKLSARWIMPGETVTIGPYTICGGYFYVGKGLTSLSGGCPDAALIDPDLPVNTRRPDYHGHRMDYWPQYCRMPPENRAAYLHWLSGDRDERIDIGYVFLYFYGIERRLLRDAPKGLVSREERLALMDELHRLKDVYTCDHSFERYVTALLSHVWAMDRQNDHCRPKKEYLHYDGLMLCAFKRTLAKVVEENRPIGAELALAWLKSHPYIPRDNRVYRHQEIFDALFTLRFKQRFGDGPILTPNKKKLRLEYRPASPTLKGYPGIICNMSDVSLDFEQIRFFENLTDTCIEQLGPYLRHTWHSACDTLTALVKLPADLFGIIPNPRFDALRSWLRQTVTKPWVMIPVKKLCAQLGEDAPGVVNKKELLYLASLLERAGFSMAPHPRYHRESTDINGTVVLCSKINEENFSPSPEFDRIMTILIMGWIIISDAEHGAESGIGLLQSVITNNTALTPSEASSLQAWFQWKIRTPATMRGLRARLGAISEQEAESIAHLMISVALADGKIGPQQIKRLQKLYTALGLNKLSVPGDIHAHSVGKSARRKKNKDEAWMTETGRAGGKAGVKLDRELLDMHQRETEDVQGVLHAIFSDDPAEECANGATNGAASDAKKAETDSAVSGLDTNHGRLYKQLITREEWPLEEIQKLCAELRLMVDGAIEVINDWAFEKIDAPLIESGDPVFVDLEMVEEIASA